ncbi:DUF732 domain-containing protein [Streptomyces sp. B3I8]|uniref:DUF732 domain-containing protein n=1 Tax=Streptomyces sp. B3I8 TaxID=3042303 RepID=UPI0027830892|nr:DUF732 domain-containing protein [Streptomyces sp. B3I8]MDQ0790383.1 hypothetical protein [Streptomyces sp. B3I8]
MPDKRSGPAEQPPSTTGGEVRLEKNSSAGPKALGRRHLAAILTATVLALVTLVAVLVTGGGEQGSARSGTAPADSSDSTDDGVPAEPRAEKSTADPTSGPPYVSVPEFSSAAARDVAFFGDVGQFSTWPDATEYAAISSDGGGYELSDFRKAVIRDARAVCKALAGGTDMNDVPDLVGLPLTDPIDQAAFLVEAVTFYCPDRIAAVTDDVYSKPVPTKQDEDCPAPSTLEATATIDRTDAADDPTSATYSVKVRNTTSYDVRVQLQQRWFADGKAPGWELSPEWVPKWDFFGETGEDQFFTIEAGTTFTYEGEQDGIYNWSRTEVRVAPEEFVFLGCGYRPGPGAAPKP